MLTHETFIATVRAVAIDWAFAHDKITAQDVDRLNAVKMVYGSGPNGTRGVTFFNRWKHITKGASEGQAMPFVEISAFGQESPCQLAGTTIHEMAHVLAGPDAGHGPKWKEACERLGLRCAKAAGTTYRMACFAPLIRDAVWLMGKPSDGEPVNLLDLFGPGASLKLKPCGAGVGTRGGKSRGQGSGSRLRLWQCGCGCKARVASDTFEAVHTPCGTAFKRA